MTDFDYKQAKKRVRQKKEFYKHFASALVIIGVCFAINEMTAPWYSWWIWVLIGMGFSVSMHFITVFGVPGLFRMDEDWEEEEIEKELRKRGKDKQYLEAPKSEEGLELKELEKDKRKNYDDSDFV